MKLGTILYTFINGQIDSGTTSPTYMNSLSNVDTIKTWKRKY